MSTKPHAPAIGRKLWTLLAVLWVYGSAQPEPPAKFTGSSWCSKHGHYQGMNCPGCAAENSGGSTVAPPPPDPRVLALERAVPRYDSLIRSLGSENLLDRDSWLALPHHTEKDFFDAANNLHQVLLEHIDADRRRANKLRTELAELEKIIDTYPALIASLREDVAANRTQRDALQAELAAAVQQLELHRRAALQLAAGTARLQERAKSDWQELHDWLGVLLPPQLVAEVSPKPYESINEPVVGAVPERQLEIAAPIPLQPAVLNPLRPPLPSLVKPAPLSGTAEDAVAQLEADAVEVHRATAANGGWELPTAIDEKRPAAAQLRQKEREVREELDGLAAEIQTALRQKKETAWNLLLAQDELKAGRESFLYRAADAWIWDNAKTAMVNEVKAEVRRRVTALSTAKAYHELTEHEVQEFISAGKHNVFSLGEQVLSVGDGLKDVLDNIETIRTRSLGYVEQATHLAAEGSPREIEEFVGGMYEDMDQDCEELVKSNLGALDIPEPWKSISAKYLVSATP